MKSLLLFASVGLLLAAEAQQFQNLDFELGRTPSGYDAFNTNPTERQQLLPGWTTYYRSHEGVEDGLNRSYAAPLFNRGNGTCIGSPCIWIGSDLAYHGRFGLDLDAGGGGGSGGETGVRQQGQVPANAKSLKIQANGDRVLIRVGQAELTAVAEAGATKGLLLSFDVRTFAGLTVDLTVATRSSVHVDNLSFSTNTATPLAPSIIFSGPLPDGRILLTWVGILQLSTSPAGPFLDTGDVGSGSRYVVPYTPFQNQPALFFRARN